MKILHTSDWHLGKKVQEIETYEGTQAFLDWLIDQIRKEEVDCLIVAGDVFDTVTPSNLAQSQYYKFLARLMDSPCKNVVVIAGNHDSPSLITAPEEALKFLNVQVVGAAKTDKIEREVLEIVGENGDLEAVIGAVPFLRERDVYRSTPEDEATSRSPKVVDAIRDHYRQVYERAVEKRGNRAIPIIFTGHMFASETPVDDEERDAYMVGNLGQTPIDVFPKEVDYVALGHIHKPLNLGSDTRNYSGSPYQMNFKEQNQTKYVRLIDFPDGHASVTSIEIPKFLQFQRLEGTVEYIKNQIKELPAQLPDAKKIFLQAVVDDEVMAGVNVPAEIGRAITDSRIYLLKTTPKTKNVGNGFLEDEDQALKDMTPENVFEKLLKEKEKELGKEFPENTRNELKRLYRSVMETIRTKEEDRKPVASEGEANEN